MMTLDAIRARLRTMNLSLVARETGIHSNVIYRLMNVDANPTYATVKKISDWLEKENN